MTNNFQVIEEWMIKEGIPVQDKDTGDLFFEIMLVRRNKDHANDSAGNCTFKIYFIDSIEGLNNIKKDIITCCDALGLRAYVSVNVKSKEEYSKMCAFKYTQNILNNEYKKPWRVGSQVFSNIKAKNADTWIVDIDDVYVHYEGDMQWVNEVEEIINSCDSKYLPAVIGYIPTRTGLHMLTRPFNSLQFKDKYKHRALFKDWNRECPDIKKNHITLLYENI